MSEDHEAQVDPSSAPDADALRALWETCPEGMAIVGADGAICHANPTFHKFFSHGDRTVGTSFRALHLAEADWAQCEAVMRSGTSAWKGPLRYIRADGSVLSAQVTLSRLDSGGGRPPRLAVIVHDSVEAVDHGKALRALTERMEVNLTATPLAVVEWDVEGRIVYWNRSAERIFGYLAGEAVGKPFLPLIVPNLAQDQVKSIVSELLDGNLANSRNINITKDRRSIICQWYNTLLHDEKGAVVAVISQAADVTEEELTREAAAAANRAKTTFLASMSHELRTPLNAILGFAQLMDRGELDVQQREHLGIIRSSGHHLLALINDVLEMSKIEVGAHHLRPKAFDLHRFIHEIDDMFRLRMSEKKLVLEIVGVESLPPLIRTDEGKLRQILINLLGNAVKFTVVGGVALRASWKADESDERRVALRFEVEDTGPGLDPQEMEEIFVPFLQARAGLQSQQGTGLGLSISRQFARLMGGDVRATASPGGGALFIAEIAAEIAEPSEVAEPQPGRQIVGLAPGQPEYKILIAEDRWENRRLLEMLLGPLGFALKSAANGVEALQIWQEWRPDLILMDMQMPVLDGYQATSRIKGTLGGHSTPIVALTASAFEENREQILASGCDDFIRKPFRPEELYAALERHLAVKFVVDSGPRPADRDAPGRRELQLDGLPAAWLTAFARANAQLDVQDMERLLSQLPRERAAAAEPLRKLMHGFAFEEIAAVLGSVTATD